MELIDRIGGLGKIRVTPEEDAKIGKLWSIIADEGQRCFLSQNCEHAPSYDALMKELFPAYQDWNGGVPRQVIATTNSHFYQGIGAYAGIRIKNRLPLSRAVGQQNVELNIIKPMAQSKSEYFMSMILEGTYKPSCVDDIVTKLGARKIPAITGVQLIPLAEKDSFTVYGIADVPHLGEVIDLYQGATVLAGHAHQIVKASVEQLNILRKDALEHENLFVREGSAEKYLNLLDQLTNQ